MGRLSLLGAGPQAAPGGGNPGGISTAPSLWFKADTQVYTDDPATTLATVDGANVAMWKDQGSSLKDLTLGSAGTYLTYKTSQLNSLPCVRSTGGLNRMLTNTSFGMAVPLHLFMVVKVVTHVNYKIIADMGATAFGATLLSGPSSGLLAISEDGAGHELDAALTVGSWGIVEALFNGASSRIQVNGNAAVTGNAGTFTPSSRFSLFNGSNGQYPLACDIAECLAYNGTSLGSTDRDAVRAYLNTRYAIY